MVSQYDNETNSTHENTGECHPRMGKGCFLEGLSHFWMNQPCWYLYEGDAWQSSFLMLRSFLHVSSVWLLQQSILDVHSCISMQSPNSNRRFWPSAAPLSVVSNRNLDLFVVRSLSISDFCCHFPLIQCGMSSHPVTTLGCAICFDLALAFWINWPTTRLDSFSFLPWTQVLVVFFCPCIWQL